LTRSQQATEPIGARAFSFLGARVDLRGPADLVEEIAALFPPAPHWTSLPPSGPRVEISLEDDVPTPGRCRLLRDGQVVWDTHLRDDIVPTAEALITAAAANQLSDRFLLFHAGAVTRDGSAILLPAPSGGGKSTLVAALLARRYACLGDDVVVYDPTARKLLPLVRSITLKRGSPELLEPLYGRRVPRPMARRFGETPVSFLTPPPTDWPMGPVEARHIVLPVRVPRRSATFAPLSRGEALPRLLGQCFNHRRLGANAVREALALIRGGEAGVLYYDDLPEAVELIASMGASP
jgi:hypothetical protein